MRCASTVLENPYYSMEETEEHSKGYVVGGNQLAVAGAAWVRAVGHRAVGKVRKM